MFFDFNVYGNPMPRANRYIMPGQIYHITHRCHGRAFLLKFARDRDTYRFMLRERLKRFPISVLGYCLTSNHTHLLLMVKGEGEETLGRFMQSLEGDFAQFYNIRKRRSGAFWDDRYHAVMVERGDYLWHCLRYIDMNMVRAGVVHNPADWNWCGYQEVAGFRSRYRVLDRSSLCEALAPGHSFEDIARHYLSTMAEAVLREQMERESCWTESVAVGSESFVRTIGEHIRTRVKIEIKSVGSVWVVREALPAYG